MKILIRAKRRIERRALIFFNRKFGDWMTVIIGIAIGSAICVPMMYLLQQMETFSFKSSSDVAAWAQAYGTILAIFVVIFLPRYEEVRRKLALKNSCYIFQRRLSVVLQALASAIEANDFDSYDEQRVHLAELVRFGRSLDITQLSVGIIWAVFDQIALAAAASELVSSGSIMQMGDKSTLESYVRRSNKYRAAFIKED
ncbi:hypothetical protein D3C72_66500 [compost metagenome]